MPKYTVHLIQTVSTAVTVDAEDQDEAVELALEKAPPATNATNRGIDAGEWVEAAIEDEDGVEVWRDDA